MGWTPMGSGSRRRAAPGSLDAAALPLTPGVAEVAGALRRDPLELAATGGEDFELAPASRRPTVPPPRPRDVTWVGEVLAGEPGVDWAGAAAAAGRWRGFELYVPSAGGCDRRSAGR